MSRPVDTHVPVAFQRRLVLPSSAALLQLTTRVRALLAACRFEPVATEARR